MEGKGSDRKAASGGLVWHECAYSYKSLSDGRIPIDRGGYSLTEAPGPAFYVDLDGATLAQDLKMAKSPLATFYAGESNIERIYILEKTISEDGSSVQVRYVRIKGTPIYPRNDAPQYPPSLDPGSAEEATWDRAFLSTHRVFLDIWM